MASNKIKGLTVEIGGETTELTAALKEVDKASKASSSELKEIERLLKMDPKSAELLSQKMTVLGESVSKAREKLKILQDAEKSAREQFERGEIGEDQLRALQRETVYAENKLKKLELQYDDVKNSAKDGGKAIKDSGEAAKEAKKGADDLSKSLDDLKDKYDDAKDSAKDAAADLGKGLAAAGAAVVAVTSAAMGYEDAMAAIQIQTGASAEEMEGYKSAVDGVFAAGLGEDLDDIASTMATIAQQSWETDPGKLEELARNALVLKDGFGFETAEQMRAVQMMVDQFGISASEAYDLIVTGAQNGLNKNGDLLDIINEYSVHYKNLGYDAQGFFNSLASGASAGVFSVDKLGDAMKEFGIRVKDSGATTIDAMSNLGFVSLAALEELRGSEAELLADISSTKDKEKLQELQQQLQGVTEEIGAMEGALGAGAMSVEDLQAAFAAGGEKAAAASQTVLEALFAIQDPLKQNEIGVALFGTMWEDMGAEAIQALTSTEDVLGDVSGAMDAVNEISMETTSRKWEQLGRTVQQDLILPLGEKLLPVAEKFFSWCIDNSETLIPLIKTLAAVIATVFVVNKVSKFIDSISKLTKAYKALQTAAKNANGGLSGTTKAMGKVGVVAAAVALTIGAAYNKWKKQNEELSAARQALADVTEAYVDAAEAAADCNKELGSEVGVIRDSYDVYQAYIAELDDITDANGRVLEGYEDRAHFILQELGGLSGQEYEIVDGVVQKYDELAGSINNVIDRQIAWDTLSAMSGSYSTARASVEGGADVIGSQANYESLISRYLNVEAILAMEGLTSAEVDERLAAYDTDMFSWIENGGREETANQIRASALILGQNQALIDRYTGLSDAYYAEDLEGMRKHVADIEEDVYYAGQTAYMVLADIALTKQEEYDNLLAWANTPGSSITPEQLENARSELAFATQQALEQYIREGASSLNGYLYNIDLQGARDALASAGWTEEEISAYMSELGEMADTKFFELAEAYMLAVQNNLDPNSTEQIMAREALMNIAQLSPFAQGASGTMMLDGEAVQLVGMDYLKSWMSAYEGYTPYGWQDYDIPQGDAYPWILGGKGNVGAKYPSEKTGGSSQSHSGGNLGSQPLQAKSQPLATELIRQQQLANKTQEDVAVKTGLSVIHAERMVEHSRYLNDMMSGAPLVTGETMEVKDLQAEVSGKLLQKILKSVQDLDLTLVLNDGTLIARTVNKTDAALGKVAASGARGALKE